MSKVTMIGCDLHDSVMVLKVAVGKEDPIDKSFYTSDLEDMISWAKEFSKQRKAIRIVLVYEASGLGFGLYDQLTDAGIECHVLAPSKLPYSSYRKKNKTDVKDAELLLEELRAHVLAGRDLPTVWVPDPETRDDREPVRMRLQLGQQRTRTKNEIKSLAKRAGLTLDKCLTRGGDWPKKGIAWLRRVAEGEVAGLSHGQQVILRSLVDIYVEYANQMKVLDKAIAELSKKERYRKPFRKLTLMKGVGTLMAMVFLTELGDLDRFKNRRQLSAYLGLVPSAHESGKRDDRKGHITRQGPSQLRKMLCQAAWTAIRCEDKWREILERIQGGSRSRKKVAVVAVMRKLGVAMWHTARSSELDRTLDMIDQERASVQAQQKGDAPVPLAVASAWQG